MIKCMCNFAHVSVFKCMSLQRSRLQWFQYFSLWYCAIRKILISLLFPFLFLFFRSLSFFSSIQLHFFASYLNSIWNAESALILESRSFVCVLWAITIKLGYSGKWKIIMNMISSENSVIDIIFKKIIQRF